MTQQRDNPTFPDALVHASSRRLSCSALRLSAQELSSIDPTHPALLGPVCYLPTESALGGLLALSKLGTQQVETINGIGGRHGQVIGRPEHFQRDVPQTHPLSEELWFLTDLLARREAQLKLQASRQCGFFPLSVGLSAPLQTLQAFNSWIAQHRPRTWDEIERREILKERSLIEQAPNLARYSLTQAAAHPEWPALDLPLGQLASGLTVIGRVGDKRSLAQKICAGLELVLELAFQAGEGEWSEAPAEVTRELWINASEARLRQVQRLRAGHFGGGTGLLVEVTLQPIPDPRAPWKTPEREHLVFAEEAEYLRATIDRWSNRASINAREADLWPETVGERLSGPLRQDPPVQRRPASYALDVSYARIPLEGNNAKGELDAFPVIALGLMQELGAQLH